MEAISELGARGCILTGDPSYYPRFGFKLSPENAPAGEPAEFFMVKVLRGRLPVGPIRFHEAFGGAAFASLLAPCA
jgi:putative acetyltransferase